MKKRKNKTKSPDSPIPSKQVKKKIYMELDIPKEYTPVAFELPSLSSDIFKLKIDPQYSTNIDYPKFSLGFHHYIHQSKDKMEITEQFKNKKKVYHIIHQFERYIDNYDQDIGGFSKSYFKLNAKPNILSRAFYKLWELFFMFDLIPTNKRGFVSAHLAEGPGSFIQATMFYRDMFGKKGVSKNDKYYAVTIYPENVKEYVPDINKKFVDHYKKEKPTRFHLHKTYSYKMLGRYPNIEHMECNNNVLTIIENFPKLLNLFCENNRITRLQNLDSIVMLHCYNNKLIKIPYFKTVDTIICNFTNLTKISSKYKIKSRVIRDDYVYYALDL